MLEKKVAGVEDTLGTVVDGIAKILAQLGARSNGCAKDDEARTSAHTRNTSHALAHAGTATPSQQEQEASPRRVEGIDAEKPTSPHSAKHNNADNVDDCGAILDHPIVVGDDASSSGGNKRCSAEASPTKGQPPQSACIQIRGSASSHLLGALLGLCLAWHLLLQAKVQISLLPRTRLWIGTPLGYAGVTDFGQTVEPAFVLPQLEPKKSRVRIFPNLVNFVIGFACALLCALYVFLPVSSASIEC